MRQHRTGRPHLPGGEKDKGTGPLLAVEDLSVCYRDRSQEVQAVREVSFRLERGEALGIIGESGSGKTSLALALLGLIPPPHRASGRVLLHGRDILSLPEEEKKKVRWRRLAMVFQNSLEVLNPVLNVGEQVGEPIRRHLDLSGHALEAELERLFALVGLEPHWREAYPHQLSGGMRQRVLLAMALSCRPELLVVDEPTTSLDAAARREIMDMLRSLRAESGIAMIVISHDLAVMEKLTDHLLVMYNGEVVESGPTAAVIEEPCHPYTLGLVNSSVEVHPYKDLWGIPGEAAPNTAPEACSFAGRCTQGRPQCRQSRPALEETSGGRAVRCHQGGIVTLLEARGISKEFALRKRTIRALWEVDLRLRHGETSALVGASGSGKSTLAHILAGLMKPDRGEVFFRGKPLRGTAEARCENGIQLVLQDPFSAVSHRLTVAEAVAEPLVINRLGSEAERLERVKAALREVQLPATDYFLESYCHALSGGQRQRLAIARALVMRPALLIADEITSMLDVSTQANLMRLLKGLQYSRGFTMLYITHDLSLARKVAERIIVLHEGRVIEEGSTKKVTEHACCRHTHDLLEAGLHP